MSANRETNAWKMILKNGERIEFTGSLLKEDGPWSVYRDVDGADIFIRASEIDFVHRKRANNGWKGGDI